MTDCELIDTFPHFRVWWAGAQGLPVGGQIDRWQRDYLAPWPELFSKQRDD
jgi:hypothetical protein